jgi:hypothetical protein
LYPRMLPALLWHCPTVATASTKLQVRDCRRAVAFPTLDDLSGLKKD